MVYGGFGGCVVIWTELDGDFSVAARALLVRKDAANVLCCLIPSAGLLTIWERTAKTGQNGNTTGLELPEKKEKDSSGRPPAISKSAGGEH
jgi:hypothetical protein